MSSFARGAERRQLNLGAPEGTERRQSADRRRENNRLYVQFRIGDEVYLTEILQVQEVLQAMEMTRVPRAPSLVVGLLNLRGDIVPVLDLRPALEVATPPSPDEAMLVVLRSELGAFSLLVDEIFDVLEVSPTMRAPTPAHLPERTRRLISGVYKLPDALLMVLDLNGIERLIESTYQLGDEPAPAFERG